jgi:hypothetical protein
MLSALLTLSVSLVLAVAAPAPVPTPSPTDWPILPGVRVGMIQAGTCERDLIARFGKSQVRAVPVGLGEGELLPGTMVFPDDSAQRLEILWRDNDKRCDPKWILIRGEESRHRTAQGIGLGTTLDELEEQNGGPFTLLGFSWDFGGTVVSWDHGDLEEKLMGCVGPAPEVCREGRVLLTLSPQSEVNFEEMAPVLGDREFPSSHPSMQRLQPKVVQVLVELPVTPSLVTDASAQKTPQIGQ